MTGRAVPEWIGSSPDQAVPKRVRLRVFERHGGVCHLTGRKIMPGDEWDLDHVQPLALSGEHRESNLAPALRASHRVKSAGETSAKAKADRVRAKHLGIWPSPKQRLRSRGFRPGRNRDFNLSKTETECGR